MIELIVFVYKKTTAHPLEYEHVSA